MMRLSTMWRVDSTLDAAGSSPVAERVLEPWPHDPHSPRFFRSSANFLYVFRQAGTTSFLRFTDSAERSRAALGAESRPGGAGHWWSPRPSGGGQRGRISVWAPRDGRGDAAEAPPRGGPRDRSPAAGPPAGALAHRAATAARPGV